MSKIKILLVLILVIASGVMLYLYIKPDLELRKSTQKQQGSAFENINNLTKNTEPPPKQVGKLSDDVEEKFKKNPDGRLPFIYGWELYTLPPEGNWDYKTTPITAQINSYDKESGMLNIYIIAPSVAPYLMQKVDIKAPENCNTENTYIKSNKDKYIYTNINFYDELKTGNTLQTFCLNNECTAIGRLCKVIVEESKKPQL